MDDRAQTIRRRLALYHRYLAIGLDASVIQLYQHLITINEEELAEIERRARPAERHGNEGGDKS